VRINKYKAAFLWDVKLNGADKKTIDRKKMEYAYPPEPGSVIIHNEAEQWSAVEPKISADDASEDGLNDLENMIYPAVGHDDAGNVALIWRKRVGKRFDLWGTNFDVATGMWRKNVLLETRDTMPANAPVPGVDAPSLSVGANGIAVVSWFYDYESDIWANVYR